MRKQHRDVVYVLKRSGAAVTGAGPEESCGGGGPGQRKEKEREGRK